MNKIRERGIITKINKGGLFSVKLPDLNHTVVCQPSGRIRIKKVHLCLGDDVDVEITPYDLDKGRIVWRH